MYCLILLKTSAPHAQSPFTEGENNCSTDFYLKLDCIRNIMYLLSKPSTMNLHHNWIPTHRPCNWRIDARIPRWRWRHWNGRGLTYGWKVSRKLCCSIGITAVSIPRLVAESYIRDSNEYKKKETWMLSWSTRSQRWRCLVMKCEEQIWFAELFFSIFVAASSAAISPPPPPVVCLEFFLLLTASLYIFVAFGFGLGIPV